MVAAYNYSSVALETQLVGQISSADLQFSVEETVGLPPVPFNVTLDPGGTEEICKVTAVTGQVLTVEREQDGTVAGNYLAGTKVKHQAIGRDLQLSRDHEAAEANIHGIGPSDAFATVGSAQTLENKTISGAANTLQAVPQSAITNLAADQAAQDSALTAHTTNNAAHGATGDVVGRTKTQTLTNKTISGSANTLSNIPLSAVVDLVARLNALESGNLLEDLQPDQFSFTNTTYSPTSGGAVRCWVPWVAPANGKVLLMFRATLRNDGSVNPTTRVGQETRTGHSAGGGTLVQGVDSASQLRVFASLENSLSFGTSKLIIGLTPGALYHTQLVHRVSSATGVITDRALIVDTRQ